MTNQLNLEIYFVFLIPFAFFLKERIADSTPCVWPLVCVVSLFRDPLLPGARYQMLADICGESATVYGTFQLLCVISVSKPEGGINDVYESVVSRTSIRPFGPKYLRGYCAHLPSQILIVRETFVPTD